eukprot:Mycagemm_TRINITY_DN10337_c1_g2::TRINITY_DN10337_c1_g2_i2::g.1076::m.1076 type:complete len:126 gc:universal TRINITY_DN10337_c1_g2_i2:1074-697(-)
MDFSSCTVCGSTLDFASVSLPLVTSEVDGTSSRGAMLDSPSFCAGAAEARASSAEAGGSARSSLPSVVASIGWSVLLVSSASLVSGAESATGGMPSATGVSGAGAAIAAVAVSSTTDFSSATGGR